MAAPQCGAADRLTLPTDSSPMRPLLRVASALTLALAPVVFLQGRRVRRSVPRLPEAPEPHEGVARGEGAPLHLVILGESTAAGVGARSHARGLAGWTATGLAAQTGRPVHWRAVGRSGASARTTTAELVPRLAGGRADVVVVALGVNDVLQLRRSAAWAADVAALVEAVRAAVGPVPVLLCGVPPVGRFPALPHPLRGVLGLRARLLDTALRRVGGTAEGAHHVPLPPLRGGHFFCEDRFHPSEEGYAVWGRALGRAAAPLLRDLPPARGV